MTKKQLKSFTQNFRDIYTIYFFLQLECIVKISMILLIGSLYIENILQMTILIQNSKTTLNCFSPYLFCKSFIQTIATKSLNFWFIKYNRCNFIIKTIWHWNYILCHSRYVIFLVPQYIICNYSTEMHLLSSKERHKHGTCDILPLSMLLFSSSFLNCQCKVIVKGDGVRERERETFENIK